MVACVILLEEAAPVLRLVNQDLHNVAYVQQRPVARASRESARSKQRKHKKQRKKHLQLKHRAELDQV